MRKNAVIIIALVVLATIMFVPVTARVTDPPAADPVCDMCTKLDQLVAAIPTASLEAITTALGSLQTAVDGLQTDVDGLQSDVDDLQTDITAIDGKIDALDAGTADAPEYIVYSTPNFGTSNGVYVTLFGLGIGAEDMVVEVMDWREEWSQIDPSQELRTNYQTCGENGIMTLTAFAPVQTCHITDNDEYIIQIKVPAAIRDKIVFSVYNGGDSIYRTGGDFKVDPI
jgi:hypothetical protein